MYADQAIRRRLGAHGLTGAIFGTINAHLAKQGLLPGQDTDALGDAGQQACLVACLGTAVIVGLSSFRGMVYGRHHRSQHSRSRRDVF